MTKNNLDSSVTTEDLAETAIIKVTCMQDAAQIYRNQLTQKEQATFLEMD